jgi:hypothetical protein
MSDVLDVIEAFADGEAVDPAALKAALADADGREHLIELLVLRDLVGGQVAMRPGVALASTHDTRPKPVLRRWLPAAAAAIAVSLLAGYLAGMRFGTPRSVATPSAKTPAPAFVQPPAPAPTHVIQLKNGVDWNEKAGGN